MRDKRYQHNVWNGLWETRDNSTMCEKVYEIKEISTQCVKRFMRDNRYQHNVWKGLWETIDNNTMCETVYERPEKVRLKLHKFTQSTKRSENWKSPTLSGESFQCRILKCVQNGLCFNRYSPIMGIRNVGFITNQYDWKSKFPSGLKGLKCLNFTKFVHGFRRCYYVTNGRTPTWHDMTWQKKSVSYL
jgi:hypothetical protein